MGISRDCPIFGGYPCIISGTGKATDFKFDGYIYRANPNKCPLKIWGKRERGCIQGLPKFFGYPYIISGTGKATDTDFKFGGYIYRSSPNKSPLNILEKMERGRIHGLPKVFGYPYIISGTGKATDFKFCRNIHRVDRNKSP